MMTPLNLPMAELKLSRKNGKVFVWCIVRKKELLMTPEEWVRQHVIHYLITHKNIPHGLIAAEMSITVNSLQRRCDLVIYDISGVPVMIVECKAPEIQLTEKAFHQIAQYNFALNVNTLMVTNGLNHIVCKINRENGEINFVDEF